ncbi:hypothetical protein H2200_003018 [Cladophialophora chaetospira]|uniref:RING-type domain-containing protein n=1 Tax=Cladophialophora chaetospira TaxID=386627 RepID=A0AA38XGP9_9EURO|nr:hypothetical protein H2200_003018 [Cladophialophora chaetospira]
MAYQPMIPGFKEIPKGLDDFPDALVYRSPRHTRPALAERNRAVIEVSDDESEDLEVLRAPPAQQVRHATTRNVISIDSSSDGEGSEMDVIVMPPRLTHKRSRTDASSLGGSPHTAARTSGKRRATPADPYAARSAASLQAVTTRQPQYQAPNNAHLMPATFSGNSKFTLGTQRKTKSPKKREAEEPPYYVDGRLDVKMYRGPGYARFPVALGTVEGHQELCDKWDADSQARTARYLAKLERKERARAQYHAYTLDDTDPDSESSDDPTIEHKAAFEEKCLESVVEIFPDIDRSFVRKKISQAPPPQMRRSEDDDDLVALGLEPLAEKIISEVLEMQSYPKDRASKSTGNAKVAADDGTGITINWDRTLPKDEMYLKDATILIARHFPHVPTHFVDHLVKQNKSIFDTYVAIHDMENQYFAVQPKPYPRRKLPRPELEKKYALKATDRRIPLEYANHVNEVQAAKQHVEREAIKDAARKAKEDAEALNVAEHVKSGAIIECKCCFDGEIPLNRVVPCMAEVPHNFCFSCVEGLADTQVGMLKHEMLCMDASGCTAKLSHEDIGRAIPITTFDRLELNQQQAEIMAANIEGLEQCPSCDYKAICEDVEQEPIFYCQNPDCSRATCRKCDKDDHSPKTCKEASVDKVLSARHLIEEARSEAIIRTCRKCKAKIVKEYGCNKMTCTRCGSLFCYNCNEDITKLGGNAYSHFGRNCILYDEPSGDRHEKEALEAEKDAISKAKAMDAELDETKLQIDTGKASKSSTRTPAMHNLLNHPAGGVFMQDMNNRAARLNDRQVQLQNMQQRIAQLEAMRPDREIGDILAEVRAMNGAFDMDNIPGPEARMQQMQQLQALQRRARANIAQRPLPQIDPPAPNPGREARRGREAARPPPRDHDMAAHHDIFANRFPDPFFLPPAYPDNNAQAGWAGFDGGGFAGAPQQLDFDLARPQAPLPRPPRPFQVDPAGGFENAPNANQRAFLGLSAAQRQALQAHADAARAQATAQRQAVQAQADAARAQATAHRRAARAQRDAAHAQREAGQAQMDAGQFIQRTFAQVQEQLAAAGININFNGEHFPMAQHAFPGNNAHGGMDGGQRYP